MQPKLSPELEFVFLVAGLKLGTPMESLGWIKYAGNHQINMVNPLTPFRTSLGRKYFRVVQIWTDYRMESKIHMKVYVKLET